MKVLFLGILLIFINTISGSTFDTITKFLSMNNYTWYHNYAISGSIALLTLTTYLLLKGELKKNIFLEKKEYYFFPLLRGLHFIIITIIIFYSLKNIPINIFTMLLATTPFFLIIFAKYILKEKLNFISWIAIVIGFIGVIFVLQPSNTSTNIYILLMFFVAITNALSFILVSKYSYLATSSGYTFYTYLPFTIFAFIFFLYDPIIPNIRELILFSAGGFFLVIAAWSFTAAFHIAGKYSSIISAFLFLQIIWASYYGVIFFEEKITFHTFIGFLIIIISGSIALYNRNK